jgi:hypothetical protein
LSSEEDCIYDYERPGPLYKVHYTAGPGVTVLGWPAKGGLYVLRDCLGLELDFLGLSRFENTVRPVYNPTTGILQENIMNGSATVNQEQKQRHEEEERYCDKSITQSLFFSFFHVFLCHIIPLDSNLYITCICSAYARSNMV